MIDLQSILNSSKEERKKMVVDAIAQRLIQIGKENNDTAMLVANYQQKGVPSYKVVLTDAKKYIEYSGLLNFIGIPMAALSIAKVILPENILLSIEKIDENINEFLEQYKRIAISSENNDLKIMYTNDGVVETLTVDEFLEDL
jgi:UDP-N-acetylmuramate-alanine ligase